MAPTPFAFVEAALDRADATRDDAEALSAYWRYGKVVLIDSAGRAFATGNEQLQALTTRELADVIDAASGEAFKRSVFLGLHATQAWFALACEKLPDAGTGIDLRRAAALWPAFESMVFAQARAVLHWRARHRHCAACGEKIAFVRAGWMGRCANCGSEHYPRTDPAVIVAISDGPRLLLGRQASWPAHRYSTLAGFVEPGESLEQAVRREVLEESGVRVTGCRYLASQPWPFPGSLMLGFLADAKPDAPRVGEELEDARWFTYDEIGSALARSSAATDDEGNQSLRLSPAISISRWLIETWYRTRV